MQGSIQFLGTGGSAGVPIIGCRCRVCVGDQEKNSRLRSSVLVRVREKSFLIDVTPDFRQQALRYRLEQPDALLLTHTHYDHVGGLEELRAYTMKSHRPVACYLSGQSFESVKRLYYYHFLPRDTSTSLRSLYAFHSFPDDSGTCEIDGVSVQYFSYRQGNMPVTGFRIGSFAYVTDIKQYDESIFSFLQHLDLLVVSAPRFEHSYMQLTLKEAIDFARKVGAKKTFFTHLSHEIDYEEVSSLLPEGVELAYDGLEQFFSIG